MAYKNPEKQRSAARVWYEAHRALTIERARKSRQRWRESHREVSRLEVRLWKRAHPDKNRERARAYYWSHAEQRRQAVRQYKRANRDKKRKWNAGRGHHPSLRWLLRKVPGICRVCVIHGGPAHHADHIVPPRLGGTDEPSNLRPMCRDHNIRRGMARLTDEELRAFPCGPVGD
jgi:HNH endonuclease